MIEKQEIYCHACGKYVHFPLDLSLNGNHVLNCPNCGHVHCMVVRDGAITNYRRDIRNGFTYVFPPQIIITTNTSVSASSWILGSQGSSTAGYKPSIMSAYSDGERRKK